MIICDRYFFTDQLLNIPEEFFFFRIAKRKSHTVSSGPACSSNPVYISLRNIWQIKIDHMPKIINIDTPGGDISCNEYPGFTGFKLFNAN